MYRLRSMVCYYGAHYQAFVRQPDSGAWLLLDDATISDVGSWDLVRSKCEKGHIQPAVLFFEADEQEPQPSHPEQQPPSPAAGERGGSQGAVPEAWPHAAAAAPISQQHSVTEPFSALSLAAPYPLTAAMRDALLPAPAQHRGGTDPAGPPQPAVPHSVGRAWAPNQAPGYSMAIDAAPASRGPSGPASLWGQPPYQQPQSAPAAGSASGPYPVEGLRAAQQGSGLAGPAFRSEASQAGQGPAGAAPSGWGGAVHPFAASLDAGSVAARSISRPPPPPLLGLSHWQAEPTQQQVQPQPRWAGHPAMPAPVLELPPPGLPPIPYPARSLPQPQPADLSRPPPLTVPFTSSRQREQSPPAAPPVRSRSGQGSTGSRSRRSRG